VLVEHQSGLKVADLNIHAIEFVYLGRRMRVGTPLRGVRSNANAGYDSGRLGEPSLPWLYRCASHRNSAEEVARKILSSADKALLVLKVCVGILEAVRSASHDSPLFGQKRSTP
jgi:hypothetical protein